MGKDCRGEEYLRKVWRHGCWERGRDQLRTRGEDFTRDQLRRGDDRERRGARSLLFRRIKTRVRRDASGIVTLFSEEEVSEEHKMEDEAERVIVFLRAFYNE